MKSSWIVNLLLVIALAGLIAAQYAIAMSRSSDPLMFIVRAMIAVPEPPRPAPKRVSSPAALPEPDAKDEKPAGPEDETEKPHPPKTAGEEPKTPDRPAPPVPEPREPSPEESPTPAGGKTEPGYRFMTDEALFERMRNHSLGNYLKKIVSTANSVLRTRTLKEMYRLEKDRIRTLIPFLQSRDRILVKNLAHLMGVFNVREAVPELVKRIPFEKDPMIVRGLLYSLGMIDDSRADAFLRETFLNENDPAIVRGVIPGLLRRMDYEVRDRAHELLPEADLLLKADLYMLLASLGDLQGIEFARTNILKDNTALKQACLEILSFSRNPADGEFLRQHKRSFFKTVNLMQAFLKAQAVIDTVALSGEEKLDAMEKDFMNNEPLLAWLALYAARQEGGEALSWLRDFAGRHALFDYPEFVYATKLRGISAREILEKSGEAADSRPESSGPAPEAPGKPVPQEAALFFRTPLQGMEVFLDGKKIDVSPGELVEGLVPGRHKLRVTAPHGESISGKIPLEAGTVLPIETTLLDSGKETVNSIGIRLKFIPAGEFVMGSAELGLKEHRVAITTPLLVGIHEITNAQFEHFDPERAKTRDRRSREDNQPVILVSWYQAVKFCNWLSRQENLIPCYDENYFYIDYRKVTGYRLLTEAEWEYVARAGSKTRYPWGDRSKGERVYFANFYPKEGQDADGFGFTAPVATYIANEFGLFDVIGNVSEWCHDWYGEDYYERFGMNRPVRDPFGPGDGSMKVARGGSWRSREAIQVAYREFAHPADRSNSRGFRICRPVKSFSVRLLEPVELDKFSEIPVRKEL